MYQNMTIFDTFNIKLNKKYNTFYILCSSKFQKIINYFGKFGNLKKFLRNHLNNINKRWNLGF
jgi:hypothetical protein